MSVFKNKSKSDIKNYRSISNLPFLSKLFEHASYKQLLTYLNDNKLLYNLQFGFRKNYSTESAMNYLIVLIIDFLGKKLIIAVIFLDYS